MIEKSVLPKKSVGGIVGLNRDVLIFLVHSLLFHIGLLGITDVLLNFYLISIGHDATTVGALQSLPRLSGLIVGIPIGMFANRLGNRRIIIYSTYGIALCTAFTVIAPNLWLIGLSRFAMGVFFGAAQIVRSPYMVTLTRSEEHTAQFSYHNLISMSAVALGSFVGGFLPLLMSSILLLTPIGDTPPQQTPLAYQAAILLAAGVVALSALPMYLLPNSGQNPSKFTPEKRKNTLRQTPWRHLSKLAFPLFVFGISGGLTFPFLNILFREQFGVPDNVVGTIIALGWVGMALIPLANPMWEVRVGRARALVGLMIVGALAFFGLAIAPTLWLGVLLFVIAIGVRNTMQPLFQPLLMDSLLAEFRNIASGVGLVAWNIGWFGATLVFGWLFGTLGYEGVMVIVSVLVLLNGISIFVVFETDHSG